MELSTYPFLCVKSRERVSGNTLYVNIKISNQVEAPKNRKFDEDKLIDRYIKVCQGLPDDGAYSIPIKSGPLVFTKHIDGKRHYGAEVVINDKFAIEKVLKSKIVLDYTIGVIFSILDGKFSDARYQAMCQFIGHNFDSDFQHYDVLEEKNIEFTRDLVLSRVSPIVTKSDIPGKFESSTNVDEKEDLVDLLYRPKKNFLTLTVRTENHALSLSFNDERIIIELTPDNFVDIYSPIKIDLKVPVRYRYNSDLNLLRVVFKTLEL